MALNKPLKCVFRMATLDGSVYVALFKYERIPNFFFMCGFIGPRYHTCTQFKDGETEVKDMQYGS